MKNMKLKTKDELLKEKQKLKRLFIIAVIVASLLILNWGWTQYNNLKEEINVAQNGNNHSTQEQKETSSKITENIKGFVYGILALEYPFFTKLLIFLGFIYLIQVMLSMTGDLIQLILIFVVGIYRGIKWGYHKLKT